MRTGLSSRGDRKGKVGRRRIAGGEGGGWRSLTDENHSLCGARIAFSIGTDSHHIIIYVCSEFSSVQSYSRVRLFVTPWTAARQASLTITNSRSLLKLMSIESVMPSNHLILSSCLQSFPTSGSFQTSQLISSGGRSVGISASTSVLPVNTQD